MRIEIELQRPFIRATDVRVSINPDFPFLTKVTPSSCLGI